MSRYSISIMALLWTLGTMAQSKPIDTQPRDTTSRTQKYGLRVGIDLGRPLRTFLENGYNGLEITGDYRLTQKVYIAAEMGNEKRTRQEDLYNFTAQGSYLKVGMDFNTYGNWYGEQNMIYFGGRYAAATFSHTLNTNQIYDTSRYWNPDSFPQGSTAPREFSGLNATWLEMLVGFKAEILKNVYMGVSGRIHFLVSRKKPEGFQNLYIPGFNKVTEGSRFGVGYNYTISYLIPLYKKGKKGEKDEN